MNASKINSKELKKFGITLFVALTILGGLLLWRKGGIGFLFWGIGIAFLLVGVTKPERLASTYRGWMRISMWMGFVMTHLILALMFYCVFTPIGLVMRLMGRDPLNLKAPKGVDSYWVKKPQTAPQRERYEKMY